jgi:hypothetical protein
MPTRYDSIHQFEPLLPSDAAQSPLLSQAHDLARSALGWRVQRCRASCAAACPSKT